MKAAKRSTSTPQIEEIVNRPYAIEIEYGERPEDGVAAYVAEWPGCITAGETREEALGRIHDAMRDYAEESLARGLAIAEPMKTYGGTVVVRMPKSLHRDAEQRARNEGVSLNQWMVTTAARAIGTEAPRRPDNATRKARPRVDPEATKPTRLTARSRADGRSALAVRLTRE